MIGGRAADGDRGYAGLATGIPAETLLGGPSLGSIGQFLSTLFRSWTVDTVPTPSNDAKKIQRRSSKTGPFRRSAPPCLQGTEQPPHTRGRDQTEPLRPSTGHSRCLRERSLGFPSTLLPRGTWLSTWSRTDRALTVGDCRRIGSLGMATPADRQGHGVVPVPCARNGNHSLPGQAVLGAVFAPRTAVYQR